MDDSTTQRKNKFQQFYAQLRTNFFNIMFELLKEKNTGLIFEPDKYEWSDEFFLSFVVNVCNYCRVIKAINDSKSIFFYWALMFFGMIYLATMSALLAYMNYFLKNRKHYVEQVVKVLRIMIILLFWVFYQPFFESFISIMKCEGNYHYLDESIECFNGIHIFYFVLCLIFLIILVVMNLIVAMLYNETQPVQEDCLSRLESSFEVALVIYRSIIVTFSNFCDGSICSWILISVYIIASAMVCYQYYKTIPFYNSFVSIFSGSLCYIYFWISINALLMKLLKVDGHIIIIFIGVPFITLLVKNLREKRIENLMKTNIDKLKLDIDSLIQVHKMTDFSKGINTDQAQRMTMIGIVNIHIMECQNGDCPCKDEYELYDISTNMFSERNKQAPHLDEVFLNHFIKRLYEDALNKFINSPSIHIAFAFYLFKSMKNIHASLVELNIAIKKKPSLQQQFTIFRYKNIIEEFIKQDHQEHKYVYPELTNVIEFERLFSEMQKSIEKVCNLQVEFWTHLTTVVPDQNILNELGKKIYIAAQEADFFWNKMCKINPNYQQALNIYGEYLREIRNHEHLGNTYIERGFNTMNAKKSIDEHAKTSDILFSPDTTVIHISGNRESIGKILKTSQGLSTVFGYSKTEVIGHSINILMPTLFAKRHTDFMERFFKTGRQVIFYQERTLFSTHRNGHCFQMKLLVKQMPSLQEGIQYVGMIRPIASDYEYMITDMEGNIDSFSKGVTGMLGLTPNLFKDKESQINIQILAPELIPFFMETFQKGRAAKSKYRESGGDTLTLVVPRDFHIIAKSENKSNTRSGSRNRTGGGGGNRGASQNNRNRSQVFKQFLKALAKPGRIQRDRMPTAKMLMQQPEYVQCERRKEVQCEITCLDIKSSSTESLKLLVFKYNKNDKGDKKKGDPLQNMMADYGGQNDNARDDNFDHFKMVSVVEDSPRDRAKRMAMNKAAKMSYELNVQQQESAGNATNPNRKVNFEENRNGSFDRNTLIMPINVNPLQSNNPTPGFQETFIQPIKMQSESISYQQNQNNSQALPNIGSQSNNNLPSIKSLGQDTGSNQQAPLRNTLKSAGQESVQQKSNQSPSKVENSADRSHSFNSSSKSIDQEPQQLKSESQAAAQQQQLEQIVENADQDLESLNQSDVMTPRLDVSGIKLESAQKEKNSFLEELKKQSFIFSENSTVKMDVKDSVNVGDKAKQEQKSFSNPQNNPNNDSSDKKSSMLAFLPEADQLVKKQNQNNIQVVFQGDDLEPQPTLENFTEEAKEEEDNDSSKQESASQSAKGTQKSKSKSRSRKSIKSQDEESKSDSENDEEEEDEDEEEDGEVEANDPSSQTKSNKQKSRSHQKSRPSSAYDSEESEEDYEEESKSDDDKKSNARSSGKADDKQPLLPLNQPTQSSKMALDNQQQNLLMPNMNDFKRGFGEENNQDYLLPDPRQIMYGNNQGTLSPRQRAGSGNESIINRDNSNRTSFFKKMNILKRDTQKIKTNPKYKCVDDGSEDENDAKGAINDDPQAMSSKELQFRDNLLKHEKRKKRKERKQKEKELKKLKAINGDDSTQGGITAGSEAVVSQSSDDDDIDSSESSSSSSSEESKNDKGTKHHNPNSKLTKKGAPRSNNDEGDVSSVTTRQNKTERSHYNLRMAIDEKFIPKSIKNLRYAAYLIFVILSLLSIVYYVLQISLFDKINQNIQNIHNSELRINHIIDITLRTRTLILVNNNYYPNLTATEKAKLINNTITELRKSATNLKNAQTDLSLQTSNLDSDQLQKINPDDVVLQYLKYPNMPETYQFSIWEAIMEIVVSAYRISTLTLQEMNDDNPTTYFVMKNCLNAVLKALNLSTDAIISESDNARDQNMKVFLYLLIAASCALFLSLIFLIPVINKIKKSKQAVLKLFTHKNVEKHIDDQLKICRNFVSTRLQQNNEGAEHDIDGEDVGNMNVNDKELQNELNNNKYMKRIRKKNKGKKLKELNTDFGSTLLKFLLFLSIIEGYFLANYLLSYKFLQEVQDLTQELKLLISRQPVQSFLLLIQKELIYTNGNALIEGEKAVTYVPKYQENLYDEEEELLDKFSANYDYHSSSYNEDFNNIIYSNVCQYVTFENTTACESFNQGILKKGIYSSVIKYWDFLRQINHDFMESDRTNSTIKQFLNDQRIQVAETMQDYYFKLALQQLVATLEKDIDNFFEIEYIQNRTIFIIYIIYLTILYLFIWRKYMSYMQNELWKTKSMLSVLPTKLCFETEEIRSFINKNSSNDILSTML